MFASMFGSSPAAPPGAPQVKDVHFLCDVFELDSGGEWRLVGEQGVDVDWTGRVLHILGGVLEISMSEATGVARFADPDDGLPCMQFSTSESEWGLKFPDNPSADQFGVILGELAQAEAKVLVEIGSSHGNSIELLELTGNGWIVVSSNLHILISRRQLDGVCFLTVQDGKGKSLFNSAIVRSLNFDFGRGGRVVSFLGRSPVEKDNRVFAIGCKIESDWVLLKNGIQTALGKNKRISEISSSEDDEVTPVSSVDAWETDSEIDSDVQTSPKSSNKLLAVGRERTFIVQKSEKGSNLRILKKRPNGKLQESAEFALLRGKQQPLLAPRSALTHQKESRLLLLEGREVAAVDLEIGKVIETYSGPAGQSIAQVIPRSKFSQNSGEPTFFGVNDRSLFLIDPRIGGNSQSVHAITYASSAGLCAGGVDGSGHIAVGSKKGSIRLFDGEANKEGALKRAKSLIEGLGDAILFLDVSSDGFWVIATCSSYAVLIGVGEEISGFKKSLGGTPSSLVYLTVACSDLVKFNIKKVIFTPARFDPGEESIVSSVGCLAVAWDLKEAKKGRSVYAVKKMKEDIVGTGFLGGDAVVAMYKGGVDIARR